MASTKSNCIHYKKSVSLKEMASTKQVASFKRNKFHDFFLKALASSGFLFSFPLLSIHSVCELRFAKCLFCDKKCFIEDKNKSFLINYGFHWPKINNKKIDCSIISMDAMSYTI